MAENKTKATEASVAAYIAAIDDPARRSDCAALAELMAEVSQYQPKMWGASIVGFGSYHYKYESGREGESCLAGFSSRKSDISLYLMNFPGRDELLARLGKHKQGKGCVYVRRLSDVDLGVLRQLVADAIAAARGRYGAVAGDAA